MCARIVVKGDAAMIAAVAARVTDGHIGVRLAAMYTIPHLAGRGHPVAVAALEALLRQQCCLFRGRGA